MADLASYVRHAERFGTGEVFETACAELDARDLGRLSLRLQNIDPRWRPPDAGSFALRLLSDDVPAADVCRMARISRQTLWRLRNGQDTPKSAPEPAFQSGESVSNRGTEGNGSRATVATAESPQRKAA